ncbi:MAG: type II toxin-antitoxin system PemK/MazF family toxin [Proteobacteria bacterium]|nr:type II toxin-antitoxin system PemK/MazF family toxin [Pseudomonadota bacterium]
MTAPKRGEVWLIRLDPTEGNEIRKTRPCVIISPDAMNRHLGTVIVVPLTSGSKPARFRAAIAYRNVPGFLLGDQIRTVSKLRLLKRLGRLDTTATSAALGVLRDMFEE